MSARSVSIVFAMVAVEAWAQTQAPAAPAAPRAVAQSVSPATTPAPVLGRLFFTPAERSRIDELRRKPPPPPQVAAVDPPRKPPPLPEYVTLNGVVQRSDGQTVVWLNNKPVRAGRSDEGIVVTPPARAGAPGGVKVTVPQTGRSVDLKVGQQLEVNSGQVQEAYRVPRTPVAVAPAPETRSEQPAPRSETPRRASRERELLRDLLREIEGPAAAKPDTAAPAAAKLDPAPGAVKTP
jgi:hypothetical protein